MRTCAETGRNSLRRQNMDDEMIVRVQQGILRGRPLRTVYNISYVAFEGVPYAAPPIGKLRFKDPQPPHTWDGIRDSDALASNICIQIVKCPRPHIVGEEDCLYLQIYAPLPLRKTTKTAVMIWIHGGHYMNGSGSFFEAQPDYLLEKEIILVTVNYRLGALGFLNLNHERASGNQGLKDQVAALQWVKKNIAAFGGDPNNITLFGCNTGAICVHLLMLSPLSRDLFHKAILQSGVAMMNSTIGDGSIITRSYMLATAIDKTSPNFEDVITSLENANASTIIKAQYDVLTLQANDQVMEIFGPSIDTFSARPFFPRPLNELLKNGNQKPVILGHTSLEYMRFYNDYSRRKLEILYAAIPSYTKKFLPLNATQEEVQELGARVQQYYFKSKKPKVMASVHDVLLCYSEICFNIPIKMLANARRISGAAPTYLYEFTYVGNHKIFNRNLYFYDDHLEDILASSQFDDVQYLLYLPFYDPRGIIFPIRRQSDDFKMVQIMTNMWTNFAKKGDPTPEKEECAADKWQPATNANFYYLDINIECRRDIVIDYDGALRRQI